MTCSSYQVQSQWEKRVLKSLNSMCMELGQSLAKPRCQNEQQELLTHWNDLSNLDMDLSLFRPVYSPKVSFHNNETKVIKQKFLLRISWKCCPNCIPLTIFRIASVIWGSHLA